MTEALSETIHFEAVVRPTTGLSMFGADAPVSAMPLADLVAPVDRRVAASRALESYGFRVKHVGTYSISGSGPRALWEATFSTRVAPQAHSLIRGNPRTEVTYLTHVADAPFVVPEEIQPLIDRAYPQRPPQFLESPLPPSVAYPHLRLPDDVALILGAKRVAERGVTGRGAVVAMVDTGFYEHRFYTSHGFRYQPTLAPDAIDVMVDEVGHGTGEAANIFACASGAHCVGIKMGDNTTLAFKTAADLRPTVITNSWGFEVDGTNSLPNYLRPLEAAVLEAVRERSITVCCSGGNGQIVFPASMPDVIAVGGVVAHPIFRDGQFVLEASSYASSYDSAIYPGRHVPDICGLVGMPPRAIYIMLPVPPESDLDMWMASGGPYPEGDETAPSDGWAVGSGTSAASPQVAGVCALLHEAHPGLPPIRMKTILMASARHVGEGHSAQGQPAGPGIDGAAGAGLVDAGAAWRLAAT